MALSASHMTSSVLCDPKKGAYGEKKAAMAFEEEKPKVGRWYFGRLLSHTEKPMHAKKKESNFVVFYIFSVKLRAVTSSTLSLVTVM